MTRHSAIVRHLVLGTAGLFVLVACQGLDFGLPGADLEVAETTDASTDATDASADDVDVWMQPDIPIDGPVTPVYDLESARFFDTPWPSDDRKTPEGFVDVSNFPASTGDVFALYMEEVGKLRGFSAAPVVYFDFDGPLAAVRPPSAAETLAPDGPIGLIRVDVGGCGDQVPLVVDYVAIGDKWLRSNSLAVRPVPGFWLEPGATYAAVVRTSLGDENGVDLEVSPAFQDTFATAPHFATTRDCFGSLGWATEDVAVASAFTVQPLVDEMRAIRNQVRDPAQVETPRLSGWTPQPDESTDRFDAYFAAYETPIYQTGTSPYREGGAFRFAADGTPEIERWETVPMTVLVPKNPPSGARPALIWVDGTGASRTRHFSRDVVRKALDAGFVVFSFTPQMHEPRGPWEEADAILDSFNYLNPASGRTVFRQQAIDTVYFLRVIREAVAGANLAGVPPLRTDRIVYGGHSQGAMVGAITAGIEDELVAYVLNGVGGYLSVTIEERKDPIDIASVVALYMGVAENRVNVIHPFVQLAQMGADVVDPQSFAPYWSGGPGNPRGTSILMTNGMQDDTTFPRSMNSLTIRGHAPVLEPAGWDVDPYDVWTAQPLQMPVRGNRVGLDGTSLTMATLLDADEGHFSLHNNPAWQDIAVGFWTSAIDGTPVLEQ